MRRLCVLLAAAAFYPSAAGAEFFGEDGREDPICFGEAAAIAARAVAKFENFFGDQCTAFLISPENHVLTAAHCLRNDDFTGGATLTFDLQPNTCDDSLTTAGTDIDVDPSDLLAINRDLDYALLQLPKDAALGSGPIRGHGWLNLDPDTRLSQLEGQDAAIFVSAFDTGRQKLQTVFDQECRITEVPTNCPQIEELGFSPPDNACLRHECDVFGGNSGSPTLRVGPAVISFVSGGETGFFISDANVDVKIRNIFPEIAAFLPDMGDDDGDHMPNGRDNCPDVPNTGQCTAGTVGVVNCIMNRDCDSAFGANDGRCEGSQEDLDFNGVGDLCETLPADQFEDNDSLGTATVIVPGLYDLTLDTRFDEDFYLLTTVEDGGDMRLTISTSPRPQLLSVDIRARDCDTCPFVLAGAERTNNGWRFEQRAVPAGRLYDIHVFEPDPRLPVSYSMTVATGIGLVDLPADRFEANNSSAAAAAWPEGCDFTGEINLDTPADLDFYKIGAVRFSVDASILFDPAAGELRLFLDGVEATDSTPVGDRTQLRIVGCGLPTSLVQVEGSRNFYDMCIRKVALEQNCPGFVDWTVFAGGGSFDYVAINPFIPGPPVDVHGDIDRRVFARILEETDVSFNWQIAAWIQYASGQGQTAQATLEVPKDPANDPVWFTARVNASGSVAGFGAWFEEEPFVRGQGAFEGPPGAITGLEGSTDEMLSALANREDGAFAIHAGIDSDGDGISDAVETETGTDPLDDDTDDDGILDGNEDIDGDGRRDFLTGETDPRVPDSDGDGVSDGVERGLTQPEGDDTDPGMFEADTDPTTTTDPTNPDTDGDGLGDGEEDANANGAHDAGETSPLVADVTDGEPAEPGDLDGDDDVDRDDLNVILAARNQPADGADDPRDLDGDGIITVLDARILVTLCTRPRCAVG